MNWYNLLKNKCPQCNKDFMSGLTVEDAVFTHKCGFKISEQKYKEICSGIISNKIASVTIPD